MKQAATKQAGPGETVRSWMCTCGHIMYFPDAMIEQLRRGGGVVCGRCLGPLTLCAPMEFDRPGQNFYRKHYDCPEGRNEIEWLATRDKSKAYSARLRLPGQRDAGGGWMEPCNV